MICWGKELILKRKHVFAEDKGKEDNARGPGSRNTKRGGRELVKKGCVERRVSVRDGSQGE